MIMILFVGSFLVDFYIWKDVKRITDKRFWHVAYAVSAVACWIFLIVTLCLPRRSADSDILTVMWMLYAYASLYLAKLAYVVCSLIGRLVRRLAGIKTKAHPAMIAGVVAGLAIMAVLWEGVFYTRYRIVVNRVEVEAPDIPRPFDGYRIAQISDIHVGTWGRDTLFVSQLVDSVNSLHPDMIVFTGDIVNRETKELEPFVKTLSRLKAKDGVYSILGNHDYGDYMDWERAADREDNNRLLASRQKEMGWVLLNNEKRFMTRDNDSIMLVGVENVGDPPFPSYGDLEKALSSSRDSLFHQNDRHFKILLSHNPVHWDDYVSRHTNIGLTLSGHTHAMQMLLRIGGWAWSPAKYRYDLWEGMHERLNENGKKTRLYVNIGAGEVGMPSRLLGAYPEITLFTLKHKRQ